MLDSGKTLKTILISNADPDFYFGAEVLKSIFPQAEVVAAPAVTEKFKAKLAAWSPRMGVNAPVAPVLPTPLAGTTLTVDGEAVELRGTTGELAHRLYVWLPSLRAVVGNIAVFGIWTADTQKDSERTAWLAQLDEIEALAPRGGGARPHGPRRPLPFKWAEAGFRRASLCAAGAAAARRGFVQTPPRKDAGPRAPMFYNGSSC